MLAEKLQERISQLEKLKGQAVMERGELMMRVEAKEAYIDEIAGRLNDLYWVEEALKNETTA